MSPTFLSEHSTQTTFKERLSMMLRQSSSYIFALVLTVTSSASLLFIMSSFLCFIAVVSLMCLVLYASLLFTLG